MSIRSVIKITDGVNNIIIGDPYLMDTHNTDTAILKLYEYIIDDNIGYLSQNNIYTIATQMIKKNEYAYLVSHVSEDNDYEYFFEFDIIKREIRIIKKEFNRFLKLIIVHQIQKKCINYKLSYGV